MRFGQTAKIDSLKALLKKDKEDTNKVIHFNSLGWELIYNKTDTSILLGRQARSLAEKLGWKKGLASSLGNLGICYHLKSDYPKALDYYLRALKMYESLGSKKGIVNNISNLGNIYQEQSDYPKALE